MRAPAPAIHPTKRKPMSKLVSTLTLALLAAFAFNAQAASHAGGAPMKASEPAAKASEAAKKEEKKAVKQEAPKK